MTKPDGEVIPAAGTGASVLGEEASEERAEAVSDGERTEEKPRASGRSA
jgi:hypothetical protein